jgi:hypothetical protein
MPYRTTLHLLLAGPPSADAVLARIRARLEAAEELDPAAVAATEEGGGWEIAAPDGAWLVRTSAVPALDADHLDEERFDDGELAAVRAARYALAVEGTLHPHDAMSSFERLLGLAHAAAPDAVGLVDRDGAAVHAGSWLREAAAPGVPVRVDALYRIHAAVRQGVAWLHTHGLARFGLPEIELFGADGGDLQVHAALVRTAANSALLLGLPAYGEPVTYGHDLQVALVPYAYCARDLRGALAEHGEREEDHPPQAAALVVWEATGPRSGAWRTAATALEDLGENPVFFLTDHETERQEALARLRWPAFARLADHFARAEGWRFLAKFGYGGEGDGTSREHLWFVVHAADASGAEGTLVNEPYQGLGLHEGERGYHHVARLTDFRVQSPLGLAGPDNLHRLVRRVLTAMQDAPH